MFKSVFSKYVSAFMLILVVSFLIVIVVSSAAIGRYSGANKREIMAQSANVISSCISNEISDISGENDDSFINEKKEKIQDLLKVATINADDVAVAFCDREGNAISFSGVAEEKLSKNEPIPKEALNDLNEGKNYYTFGYAKGMFKHMQAVYASPVFNEKGEVLGAVYISSTSLMMVDLWGTLFRIVMGSVIWVLIAALIAVYFISERVISPLREISSAAKRFAAGQFDVRVPVRGSDEVAEVAKAFNNMAESLDNYDNMRNTFMSNVSHDLRSPMTSISGFIDGILDGVIPPEQHKYYLQIVSSEIKRLSRLVASLLDLSRIQAGERKFTMGEFDICEMSRQIVISFEQKITAKNLDVSIEFEEEKMLVKADKDAVYQVLYNLCDNAVKFASEGGRLELEIKYMKGKKLVVSVYNEGQGISPEDINMVFDRFYKSDKSRGLNKNGAGLGLFISKTIMDAHGEKIWVESEFGKNCKFSFTLECE